MRVNELEKQTLNQLKAGADSCFHDASVNDRDLVNVEHLLKAQVYLSEIAHRYDAKIALRDLILEIVVIVLIAGEIGIAWMEGRSQSRALDAMAESANQSVIAMKSVSTSLSKLNDKQDRALEAQRTANQNLQDSLNQTTSMATAQRKQLKIIESEQGAKLAQAAKKPKFQVTINGNSLSIPNLPLIARDQTETSQTYDLVVANIGDATAHNGSLRISTDAKDVQITASGANRLILITGPKDVEGVAYMTPFPYLRAGIRFTIPMTITYPKGAQPFTVLVSVDVDELDAGTMLGALVVNPSGGLNPSPRP